MAERSALLKAVSGAFLGSLAPVSPSETPEGLHLSVLLLPQRLATCPSRPSRPLPPPPGRPFVPQEPRSGRPLGSSRLAPFQCLPRRAHPGPSSPGPRGPFRPSVIRQPEAEQPPPRAVQARGTRRGCGAGRALPAATPRSPARGRVGPRPQPLPVPCPLRCRPAGPGGRRQEGEGGASGGCSGCGGGNSDGSQGLGNSAPLVEPLRRGDPGSGRQCSPEREQLVAFLILGTWPPLFALCLSTRPTNALY